MLFQWHVGTSGEFDPAVRGTSDAVRFVLTEDQKAVMISHRNVISNVMQYTLYEQKGRSMNGVETGVKLGLLPFSHIYGLVVIAHSGPFRGDEVVVLPKFELTEYLQAIQRFKISHVVVVSLRHSLLKMKLHGSLTGARSLRSLFGC